MHIKHLMSGSSGCAIAVWGMETLLLIDAGWSAQKNIRPCLANYVKTWPDFIIASHLHKQDHITHAATKVFKDVPFIVPEDPTVHGGYPTILNHRIVEIGEEQQLGEFRFFYTYTRHHPKFETRAIHLMDADGATASFVVEGKVLDARPFYNRDYIYCEANHNEFLLEQFPNPSSWYHSSNVECGRFLGEVCKYGSTPQHIQIGNISSDRNNHALARSDVVDEMGFGHPSLSVTERATPTKTIIVNKKEIVFDKPEANDIMEEKGEEDGYYQQKRS